MLIALGKSFTCDISLSESKATFKSRISSNVLFYCSIYLRKLGTSSDRALGQSLSCGGSLRTLFARSS
jgi:hypothetical protein